MITLRNVSKSYDKSKRAVDRMSLEIRDGEIFGFLGPNGAGKTTAIKMITGVLSPDEGEIIVAGHDMSQDALAAKREIGFVSDDPNIFPRLKGIEYLRFIADIYAVPEEGRAAKISELTEAFGLSDVLDQRLQSYSHGMKQKMVLVGALLHDPPLWILDEPMTGLDPKSSFILKQMMREHADSGNTVLFSTHVLDVAEKVCDRLAIINKGEVLFAGTIAELHASYEEDDSLEEMFLELVEDSEESRPQDPREQEELGLNRRGGLFGRRKR